MKLRAMGGVDLVPSVGRAGGNHADRRGSRYHGANLNGRSVGAKKAAIREIKGVLFVASRMIPRRVQSIETMPFIFHVWAVSQRETHPPENPNPALQHLVERMKRTPFRRCPRQRDVDVRQCGCFLFNSKCSSPL